MNENMDDPTPAVMELSRKTEEIENLDLEVEIVDWHLAEEGRNQRSGEGRRHQKGKRKQRRYFYTTEATICTAIE